MFPSLRIERPVKAFSLSFARERGRVGFRELFRPSPSPSPVSGGGDKGKIAGRWSHRIHLLTTAVFCAALLVGCHSKDRFTGAAPAAPDPKVGDIGDTTAVVFWSTDLPATSVVEFGAADSYGIFAGDEANQTMAHRVPLSALGAASNYHYRVRSLDERGNTLFSFDRTFRTRAAGQTAGSVLIREDFEGAGSSAWAPQTFSDSQAVTVVEPGAAPAASHGATSLLLTVHLDPDDPSNKFTKGETLVFFRDMPGEVPMDFADLSGLTATAHIFATTGSQGDPSRRNGIQLFVKDALGRSQYGPYVNIDTENVWFQVTMVIGGPVGAPPQNAFSETGFDPATITLGGVKVGGGGGSSVSFDGLIYVDDVVFK